jgi:hypothetical protein
MSQEAETRREIANRLEAVVRVLNAKIGKYGSATHHLSNVIRAMSLAFLGSISHWPDVVQSAGRLSAALREEDLNEWRNIVSDAKPYLDEASHIAKTGLGALKHEILSHTLGVIQADTFEHVSKVAQLACLLAHGDSMPTARKDI